MFAKEQRCNSETNLASELVVPTNRQLEIKQGDMPKTNFTKKDPKNNSTASFLVRHRANQSPSHETVDRVSA